MPASTRSRLSHDELQRAQGVVSLLGLVLIWGVLGVIPKFLSAYMPVLQQLYIRLALGSVFSFVFMYMDATKPRQNVSAWPLRQWGLLFIRSLLYYSVGAVLYNFAIQFTLVAQAAFVSALPFTAIFGFLFFGEPLSLRKVGWVTLSFMGVVILFWSQLAYGLAGLGELLALGSGAAISLAMLLRRSQSSVVNDRAAGAVMLGMASVLTLCHSLLAGDGVPRFDWSGAVWGVLFLGSLAVAAMSFLMNYGFARVEPALANTILTLDAPSAAVFGWLFFQQMPSYVALLSGALMVVSIIGMQKEESTHDATGS